METKIETNNLEKIAFILKTIAHPVRIGIVELLTHHDRLSVTEICERLDTEQSLTSHHLTGMKLKGVLFCEREGKKIYYSLKLKEIEKVISCMENCSIPL